MTLDPFCMKHNRELMRERRKFRRQLKIVIWTMLFIGVCLVSISSVLIIDSTHQHLLKSLGIIGWVLNCFAGALFFKLWLDGLDETR